MKAIFRMDHTPTERRQFGHPDSALAALQEAPEGVARLQIQDKPAISHLPDSCTSTELSLFFYECAILFSTYEPKAPCTMSLKA